MTSIGICLPTYNESSNLPVIVGQILACLPQVRIFVIDDNSPDGTGDIAAELARQDSRISVVARPAKTGLGSAYREGFRRILAETDLRLLVQMDADLSHPVRHLPAMITRAGAADLVIGSRYVPGGSIANWHYARRLLSRFGSVYARLWLGLSIRDLTGGFKVWRRALLEKVLAAPLSGSGYVFQIEMTYHAHCLGARIAEVPITFVDRTAGRSKMSMPIALEACWQVPVLRLANRVVRRT